MKQTYELRLNFKVHPTNHLLVAEVEVRYSTFSSMETLFYIEGEPGRVSEDHVKELMHRAKYLVLDYTEMWREVNDTWEMRTIQFVEVDQ